MADEVLQADANNYRVTAGVTNDADQDILMVRLDASTKRLLVDALLNSSSTVGHNITGISDGRTTIAVIGSPHAIGAGTAKKVIIAPLESNASSSVVVGGTSVIFASATRRGIQVYKANTITLEIDSLSDVYVDVGAPGDGISFIYLT